MAICTVYFEDESKTCAFTLAVLNLLVQNQALTENVPAILKKCYKEWGSRLF